MDSSNIRYLANPNLMLREIAGETLLIPVGPAAQGNMLFPLNETGHFLWTLLQTPRTMEEILAAAHEEYDDPDGSMEQAIADFLEKHVQTRLILKQEAAL